MKKRSTIKFPLLRMTFILTMVCLFNNAFAAFCSLRDPTVAIQTLYPESNQYRSIVRAVDQQVREQVSERLPFTLHFNEIGKHTLYQVLENGNPTGFVQARTERSRWGLIEIAWAITPDLALENLVFQRCRSPECDDKLKTELQSKLVGMQVPELLQLITTDGRDLSHKAKILFPDHQKLHLNIIHSALKTLAVTELAWNDIVLSSIANSVNEESTAD